MKISFTITRSVFFAVCLIFFCVFFAGTAPAEETDPSLTSDWTGSCDAGDEPDPYVYVYGSCPKPDRFECQFDHDHFYEPGYHKLIRSYCALDKRKHSEYYPKGAPPSYVICRQTIPCAQFCASNQPERARCSECYEIWKKRRCADDHTIESLDCPEGNWRVYDRKTCQEIWPETTGPMVCVDTETPGYARCLSKEYYESSVAAGRIKERAEEEKEPEEPKECKMITDFVSKYNGKFLYPACQDEVTIVIQDCNPATGEPEPFPRSCIGLGYRSCQDRYELGTHCSDREPTRSPEKLLGILFGKGRDGKRLIDDPNLLAQFIANLQGLEYNIIYLDPEFRARLSDADWLNLIRAWEAINDGKTEASRLAGDGNLSRFFHVLEDFSDYEKRRLAGETDLGELPRDADWARSEYQKIFGQPFDSDAWSLWQDDLFQKKVLEDMKNRYEEAAAKERQERHERSVAEAERIQKIREIMMEMEQNPGWTRLGRLGAVIPGLSYFHPIIREEIFNNPDVPFHQKAFFALGGLGNAGLTLASGGMLGTTLQAGALLTEGAIQASYVQDPNEPLHWKVIGVAGMAANVSQLRSLHSLEKIADEGKLMRAIVDDKTGEMFIVQHFPDKVPSGRPFTPAYVSKEAGQVIVKPGHTPADVAASIGFGMAGEQKAVEGVKAQLRSEPSDDETESR